jgi:hypothetical protein
LVTFAHGLVGCRTPAQQLRASARRSPALVV